jgi:exopolyphosphatase/guanosine-5'-triphosphate,3'-diphosphate pyrophosphatase
VCELYKPSQLIGSAGAFESFATMLNPNLDIKSLKSTTIDKTAYQKLSYHLVCSSHKERENCEGLIKLRVDMIVIAALITDHILEMIKPERLSVSTYDLKMGVLSSLQG